MQIPKMTCLVEVLEERKTTVPRDPLGWRAGRQRILRPVQLLPKQKRLQVLGIRVPVREKGLRKEGMQLCGMTPCLGHGREGSLVKALLKVPHAQLQPTQIDHRISVVLPDDGEGQTFCGVEDVQSWCPGHCLSVRVGCDAAHDTNTPTVLNCW